MRGTDIAYGAVNAIEAIAELGRPYPMLLCARYAMSGTGIAYHATRYTMCSTDLWYATTTCGMLISGTDMWFATTGTDMWYASPVLRCARSMPVLRYAMLLPGRYDVALHRMKEPLEALVQCLGTLPPIALRDVRYHLRGRSKDNTIAMSANRALLRLLDQKGLTDLEKLIPPEEEEEEDDVFTAISGLRFSSFLARYHARRCLVLRGRMLMISCYALSGTGRAYGGYQAMRFLVLTGHAVILLSCYYALLCTGIAHTDGGDSLCGAGTDRAAQCGTCIPLCPALIQRVILLKCYAMSGTDPAYAATSVGSGSGWITASSADVLPEARHLTGTHLWRMGPAQQNLTRTKQEKKKMTHRSRAVAGGEGRGREGGGAVAAWPPRRALGV
eukprot:3633941-Rhodomonas_salina.2